MKKVFTIISIIAMLFCIAGCSGVKGENVKIRYEDEAMVSFYAVCPECGHKDGPEGVNISDGEDYNGVYFCSRCGEMYDISVKR